MATRMERSPEAHSQILDVHLLDVLAQVEAVLRGGRDVQREGLRVRNVAGASAAKRRASAVKIQKHVAQMRKECRALTRVVDELGEIADDLLASLQVD
jgi:phage host-nuclease inhibitor protein Gam